MTDRDQGQNSMDSDARLDLALDIAGLGAWDLDLSTARMTWSQQATRIYGGGPDELGELKTWLGHVHPDDQPPLLALFAAPEDGDDREGCESSFRFTRPDGEQRWLSKRCRILRDPDGKPVQLSGIVADDTNRRRAADDRQQLLFDLQHRVKNILAVVRSISARTLETSETLEDYSAHFDGRLGALGRVQNALVRRVNGELDLEDLIREEVLQAAASDGDNLRIEGPPVRLGQRSAELLGLAVHELVTNAVKFGALSTDEGEIDLTWDVTTIRDKPWMRLHWRESGVPMTGAASDRQGFGRDLIEQGLPYQLGARSSLRFEPDGLDCVIEIPLESAPGGRGA